MQKLNKLIGYLSEINITEHDVIVVVNDTHATERLRHLSGRQIIVSYPQMEAEGDSSDHSRSSYSAAIFVLEPISGVLCTPQSEQLQYRGMLKSVDDIIASIRLATTDFENSKGLNGMQLQSSSVVPVYKPFGEWCGWLIELGFK